MMTKEKFLTASDVAGMTSLSRATIDRKVKTGDFPKPISISERRKAWPADCVLAWMAEKVAA
ncbi:prophage regulatory protein [Sphingomonas sp. PvP055]|uniref:helix-turn-helix transcriptional regulator n=1 Tax=Sphingomonas sp. PvP055 TaxID=3156391 RepID=UPI003396B675